MREAVADQSSQSIRNLARNPQLNSSFGMAGMGNTTFTTTIDTSIYLSGGGSYRATVTTPGIYGLGIKVLVASGEVLPGRWRWTARVRVSRAVSVKTFGEYYIGTTYTGIQGTTYAVPANQWTTLSGDATVATPNPAMAFGFGILCSDPLLVAGDQVWVDSMVITRDEPRHPVDLVDGTVPGWRWTSTAGQSVSVGYPYTLESIAGTPVVSVVGTATSATFTSLGAYDGRTTYLVTDRVQVLPSGGSALIAEAVIANASQTAYLRQDGTGATGGAYIVRPQFVNGGGAAGAYGTQATYRPAAGTRNVVANSFPDGLASTRICVNGQGFASRTGMTVGDGWTYTPNQVRTLTPTNGGRTVEAPIFMVQFKGEHNDETMKRVSAWLARKYVAPAVVNLAKSPTSAVNTGWFGAYTPSFTAVRTAGTTPGNTNFFYRLTANAVGTGTGYFAVAYGQAAGGAQVTPGNTYTVSANVRSSRAGVPTGIKLRLRWKDAGGATLSDAPMTVAASYASATWYRLSVTATAPTNASYIEVMGGWDQISDYSTMVVVGDTVDMTEVMVTEGTTVWDYADGSSVGWQWDGTAGTSTSRAATNIPAGY